MASVLSRRRTPKADGDHTPPAPGSPDDSSPVPSQFTLPQPAFKRRRVPEMAAGALMVALGALVFLWLAGGEQSRTVALLANDVSQGQIIQASDLVQTEISATIDVAAVDWLAVSQVVGGMAVADLPARSLITRESVAAAPPLPAGYREVGVVLKAGPMPTLDLAPADRVDVLQTSATAGQTSTVVATDVTVRSLIGGDGSYFVSLVVAETDAVSVAAAAHANELRLVRVPS